LDAQITIQQFGKLGACRAGDESYIDFITPKTPENSPFLSKPIIGNAPEIAMPFMHNLQLTQAGKGLNVLSNSGAKLTLFNLKGGIVMQKELGTGEQLVSLQNLKSGIYIAQLRQGSQVKTIKVNR
jgi:hypothetical protein